MKHMASIKRSCSLAILLLLLAPVAEFAQTPQKDSRKLFNYEYTVSDLPNGLRLVTVPTDYPRLVALYIVVQTGSRNEVEPGKSGYAHFFEHMMFRGSENYTPEQRDAILKRAGADANAYTSDDRTVYHEVFAKEDLEEILKLEADRFLRLKYGIDAYKTEANAVLGEYNKNSANPVSKLFETLRATAFKNHSYSHTTMGFLKDIQDMPNQYDYSLQFYNRYYRPEYTTILLVGDVTAPRALELVKKYWGDWKRGTHVANVPPEPQQTGPRTAHVDWPTPTLPFLAVAFRGPAFSETSKDKVALNLLAEIAFGENSDLYKRLILTEQKIDALSPVFSDRKDPELFTVIARVKKQEDVEYVRNEVLKTFELFTKETIPVDKLNATRSRIRYGFALGMNSSAAIASGLAPYISLTRTPESINKVFSLVETVTPEDVRAAAARYFNQNNRTIVTLSAVTKRGGEAR